MVRLEDLTEEQKAEFNKELLKWEEEFGINKVTEEDLEKMALEQLKG